MKVFGWIKNNKLVTFLILLVGFLLLKNRLTPLKQQVASRSVGLQNEGVALPPADLKSQGFNVASLPQAGGGEAAPQPEIKDRLVVEESNISLVVDNVREKVDKILDEVNKKNGYMVSSSLSQPQEIPFAHLVVRVPANELRPTLEWLRSLSIKVTSENLVGTDVTDQYTDLEARLTTLNKTKAKFEEIMTKAFSVNEIMEVQRQLIYLQDQIDRIKGQQKYLEKTAENAKLTIYLASDEWALPYSPQGSTFRPKVIFKQAVRSLVTALRGLAKLGIWVIVFSVIWLPALLIYKWWHKRK